MNRALKIRAYQFLWAIKISTIILVVMFVSSSLLILLGNQSVGFDVISAFFRKHLFSAILIFFANVMGIVTFLFAISDGTMDLDTSVRLGISRRDYFFVSMLFYGLISLVGSFTSGLASQRWDVPLSKLLQLGMSNINLDPWFGMLCGLVIISLMAYAFYCFGWKVFFFFLGVLVLVIIFFGTGSFGIFGNVETIKKLFLWLSQKDSLINTLEYLFYFLLFVGYYWVTQNIEIK